MEMKYIFPFLFLLTLCGWAAEPTPQALKDVGIDQNLGAHIPLNETFIDESGKEVSLAHFFDGKKPVVVLLNYYGCPMLCGLLLNAARDSMQAMNWMPGEHYKIVTISIDPKEGSDLAAAKKSSVLGSLKNEKFKSAASENWHFLVGKGGSEARVAAALGFHYKWIAEEKQYAHGAAIFLLSPNGKISRVLQGLDFPPRDLKLGLLDAGEGKVGSFAEKLLLFCYHYDPKGNKNTLLASRLVSLGGAAMIIAFLIFYGWWFFHSRRKGKSCSLSP